MSGASSFMLVSARKGNTMAKRKGKVELIEKTLDQEIQDGVVEIPQQIPSPSTPQNTNNQMEREEPLAARMASVYKISFVGRAYVENRFPQSVLWADRFAQEWKADGNFDFIEVAHPAAKDAIVNGLKNIRAVEKKVGTTYVEAVKKVEKVIQQLRA